MHERLWLCRGLWCLLLCGCASETPNQFPIAGTVKFQGQPLNEGAIQFEPTSPDQSTFSGAGIRNGSYSIAAEQGLAPGTYRVRISAGEPTAAAAPAAPGESGPPAKERLPAKYNVETTLQAEVKKDGENRFDFDL